MLPLVLFALTVRNRQVLLPTLVGSKMQIPSL